MRSALHIAPFLLLLTACQKEYEAPLPNTSWDLFSSTGTTPVDTRAQGRMEGVYAVAQGADLVGDEVVVKWSSTQVGMDTTYHVSIFCGTNIAYLSGEGRYLDSTLLLNMYWRTLANTGTGLCRLTITYGGGVRALWSNEPLGADSVRITGAYGIDADLPDRPFTLHYRRPLAQANDLVVLAHRCGGRNSDLLPASENSLEMIRLAPRLGATGVEMDVRLTSDGVPVIYHDETLNDRTIRPCGLFGPIGNYSYAQLNGLVRLINGERIPTLREALAAVVNETPLAYVWMDIKLTGSLEVIRNIQREYITQAQSSGRDVHILIGLPAQEQLSNFLALPDHANAPSLCELEISDVQAANSEVWAPRWTLGLQNAEVAQVHGQGRKAFVWTLDQPDYVQEFMQAGNFDGILSNYPTLIAYHAYARP